MEYVVLSQFRRIINIRQLNNLMEFMNGMIQWLTHDLLVSLLGESVFFNESLEWMIQRQIATFLTAPFHYLKKKMCIQELMGGI